MTSLCRDFESNAMLPHREKRLDCTVFPTVTNVDDTGRNRRAEAQSSAGRHGAHSRHRDEMAYSRRTTARSRAYGVYAADSGTSVVVGHSSTHHDSASLIFKLNESWTFS